MELFSTIPTHHKYPLNGIFSTVKTYTNTTFYACVRTANFTYEFTYVLTMLVGLFYNLDILGIL